MIKIKTTLGILEISHLFLELPVNEDKQNFQ